MRDQTQPPPGADVAGRRVRAAPRIRLGVPRGGVRDVTGARLGMPAVTGGWWMGGVPCVTEQWDGRSSPQESLAWVERRGSSDSSEAATVLSPGAVRKAV